MKWALSIAFLSLLAGCGTPPPPPENPPPEPAPAAAPAPEPAPAPAPAAQPAQEPRPDPSKPPPEVEAGCLPECSMVHGKCQALVHPGPTFDGEDETEEIGPGPKPREKIVRPCAARCCRGQDD